MPDPVLSSLLRINRARVRVLRREMAPFGYSGTMHLLVRYVSQKPGASQEEVACVYALDKTNVARDARRLEEMGHIRRSVDPANRRRKQLYLTEEGQKMVRIIAGVYDAFAAKLSEDLSPEDWQQLQRLLAQLEKNVISGS